jgi:ABC transport system ATP-binding/permease protein
MDRNPQLVVIEGALAGQVFEVTADGLDIGRDATCEVALPDPGVSRSHARVFLHNSAVWVQDNGSRNGAFVNGKRLQRPKTLSPGAVLKVGDHRFEVRLNSEPAPSPVVRDSAVPPVVEEGPTDVMPATSAGGSEPAFSIEPTVSMPAPAGSRGSMSRARVAIGAVVLVLAVAGIAVALLSG